MGRRINENGLLVTFEGVERVGKSTQIVLVTRWLNEQNIPVAVVREPGGTVLGETLRRVVLHDVAIVSPWSELFLFAAARAELVQTVIRPQLEEGTVIILDRYVDSSLAYQGYGRGLPIEDVVYVNNMATGGLKPDLTFWLRGPSFDTGTKPDQIESRERSYFDRVFGGYEELARKDPDRWRVIDSTQSVDVVFQSICRHLEPWIVNLGGG